MNNLFGGYIRQLREENNLLQRQVAAALEIDTPMLSKIERGERRAKRDQVLILADLFGMDNKTLTVIWLKDAVWKILDNEPLAGDTIKSLYDEIRAKN